MRSTSARHLWMAWAYSWDEGGKAMRSTSARHLWMAWAYSWDEGGKVAVVVMWKRHLSSWVCLGCINSSWGEGEGTRVL